MRILITGGAGFIGSHIAEYLAGAGEQVTVVDNFDPFYPAEFKEQNVGHLIAQAVATISNADICDLPALAVAFERARPDIVIHCAALAGVTQSLDNAAAYEEVNIGGTLNVLRMCRTHRVFKMIFASSSSVYGNSPCPYHEETPRRPLSPYGQTKVAGEWLCEGYSATYGFTVRTMRFFSVYGPRMRPDLAIYKFVEAIESGKTITVYGDGSQMRDYTHVSDVVAAVRYMTCFDSGQYHETYNVGSGRPVSTADLIAIIENLCGKKAIVDFDEFRSCEPFATWADTGKIYHRYNWEPARRLGPGLAEFIDWYRKNRANQPR
jgi:UDP-glucuronate 4-epimerase